MQLPVWEIYKSAKAQIFTHFDSSIKLLRKRNSDRYREPQQLRFTKPQTGLYSIDLRAMYSISEDYKDKNWAISKWLVLFFGLSLLHLDEVGTAFANEIMSTIPADDRCRKFADYIVNHYIDFTPDSWGSSPQQDPTITNAAKSFHCHLNADIRTPHPHLNVM